jgi:hypothetical protein
LGSDRRTFVSAGAPFLVGAALAAGAVACEGPKTDRPSPVAWSPEIDAAVDAGPASPVPGDMHVRRLANRSAYLPPQCYTTTAAADGGRASNPCYVCHTRSEPPNFVDDGDLQVTLSLPLVATRNPWTNLFAPPIARAAPVSDADTLAYVRRGNYLDEAGHIALARAFEKLPAAWDGNGNGVWDGFVPDAGFQFDAEGFDHAPDGGLTGWRAFAYYPFPGTFFPTNGSADDVLIRLDPRLRQDAAGHYDAAVYAVNLAVVEALVTRRDVSIAAADERALGVDLDLDGRMGRATRVAFQAARDGTERTRMRYAGRAGADATFPIAPGLFPVGTEFLHSVRYLDVGPDGVVTMAARMKELRYAKKAAWLTHKELKARATTETLEQAQSSDGSREVPWERERGIYNGQGWFFQGFIEARDGSLRPQGYEETASCVGCHGGIGATTDGIFSFARKLGGAAPAGGWFHWSQRSLRGLPEPRRIDGLYEYTTYLEQAGAGDELRENREVLARFFDDQGRLVPSAVAELHGDVASLLLPSPGRALDLDRAYRAIVVEQSFDRGRDAVLHPTERVYATAPIGARTGISHPIAALRLAAIAAQGTPSR